MSKSDGYGTAATVIAAAVILFSLGFGLYSIGHKFGSDHQRGIDYAAGYNTTTEARIKETCLNTEPVALQKCIKEAVEASTERQRGKQDLQAQQEMADWAFLMMVISAVTLLITTVGVWLVRQTLIETRKATDAAQAAVAVTRDIGTAQTQAYVLVDTIRVSSLIRTTAAKSDKSEVRVLLKFVNAGKTPASNLRIFREAYYWQDGTKKYIKVKFEGTRPETLVPGEPLEIATIIPASKTMLAKMNDGSFCIWFGGEISYQTVINSRRRAYEFHYKIAEASSQMTHRVELEPNGNGFKEYPSRDEYKVHVSPR